MTFFVISRCAIRGSCKLRVTAPTAAAWGNVTPAGRRCEIVEYFTGCLVDYHSPHRNLQNDIFTTRSVPLSPLAVPSAAGCVLGVISEMEQRIETFCRFDVNRSP